MGREPYISIDIETTGLDPSYCQILEIGAVIDDWEQSIEYLPRFHCYVVNEHIIGEPYALGMHPVILRRIATEKKGFDYLLPEDITFEFSYWLNRHDIFPDENHITPAGKNYASFDKQFLDKLPGWKDNIKTRHRTIDPGNLFWYPETDRGLPNLKTCMQRAGIEGAVAHTAVEDALIVVKLIRKHRENLNG